VIGTGHQVLVEPVGNVVGSAVGDQGVDQSVTTRGSEICVRKTSRFQLFT